MSWQGGRRLAGMTKGSDTLSFAYNESGLRTSKTVNGVAHSYVWQGSKLAADITDAYALYFHYDSTGDVIGFTRTANGTDTEYFYVKNLQGDILKVITATGTEAATYTYDAWGRVLTSTGDLADINPLRYRGYYYDTETGLYYLQSRYYDPEVSRFINPDSFATTDVDGVLSANMFAYCENNPVTRSDSTGCAFGTLLGVALIAGLVALLSGCSSKSSSALPSDYIDCTNSRQNCYQYALSYIGINTPDCFVDPGYRQSYSGGSNSISSLADLKAGVETDLQAFNVKYTSYYDYSQIDTLPDGCTLVAGYTFSASDLFWGDYTDYHFAVRLSDGSWADKPGANSSRYNQLFFDGDVWTGVDGKSLGTASNTIFFVIYN